MSTPKIAYIQAQWHSDITNSCKRSFVAKIQAKGFEKSNIDFFEVPGSLEIPLFAKRLAKTGRYAAVCASGLVVDGGIYRHEFVASAVLQGIVQASLETEVPILSAVLTPHQFQESQPHRSFFQQHMRTKGEELAEACSAIIRESSRIDSK